MHRREVKQLTKRRIGLIQLTRSIELLYEFNDPISAITLAGAAEEIFGRIAAKKGYYTSLEDNAEWIRGLARYAKTSIPTFKEAREALTDVRNSLKHNHTGDSSKKEQADYHFEAEEIILRAINNHLKAFNCLPGNQKVQNAYWNLRL